MTENMRNSATLGSAVALSRFKLANVPVPGILDKLKNFGAGQLGAAKSLVANIRGGLGGQMNPEVITSTVPTHSMDIARATHRQEALGNLNTLAPSLAAGGLYALHRHNQNMDAQARRQQAMMMAQQGYPSAM